MGSLLQRAAPTMEVASIDFRRLTIFSRIRFGPHLIAVDAWVPIYFVLTDFASQSSTARHFFASRAPPWVSARSSFCLVVSELNCFWRVSASDRFTSLDFIEDLHERLQSLMVTAYRTERTEGVEPSTSTLARSHSTAELRAQKRTERNCRVFE